MAPTPTDPAAPADQALPLLGELVVQNGRFAGARRPLTVATTLIGRGPQCDVRLNVAAVEPLHCVLACGPEGLVIRDLGSASGTFVNGEAITAQPLADGDHLAVGPFQFTIEIPPSTAGKVVQDELEAERDALRIQAAAVVAQQAALAEEEARLRQQRSALGKQKEQLATHLENRRRDLLDLQEQVRQDRAVLKAEAAAAHQEQDDLRQTAIKLRDEALRDRQAAEKERRRLVELRRRLKRRWHRHWDRKEAEIARREAALAEGREKVHQEGEATRKERAALVQAQLRFNGEAELERRRLRDEWQQLGLAQQQWEATLNQEHAERERQRRDLDQRCAAASAAEKALAVELRSFEQSRARLNLELQGLDARVRNSRQKLFEQEQALARVELVLRASGKELSSPEGTSASAALVPVAAAVRERPASETPECWTRLAGALADHRRHLAEQWHQFLLAQAAWETEHHAALAQIEATEQGLRDREMRLVSQENALAAHEQALAAAGDELRRRHQALMEVRCGLEGWQARLTAREAALEGEKGALLARARAAEDAASTQARRFEELRQRRLKRRSEEIEHVRIARQRYEEMRQELATLWQECQERRAALAREQRDLAGQALALEHLRQDLTARSSDPAAAGRKLERLQRRQTASFEAQEQAMEEGRQRLEKEAKRLDAEAQRLKKVEEELTTHREEWAREQADWEDRCAAAVRDERSHQLELRRLQALHEQDEQQLALLREELERVARMLIDEPELPLALPVSQAA